MLAKLRGFMATEIFKYLFFGILATLVYMVSRTLIFQLTKQGTLSAVLANAIAIIFAFFTNDIFVFNQETAGMAVSYSHLTLPTSHSGESLVGSRGL